MKGILQATLTLAFIATIVGVLALRIWSWFGFDLDDTRTLYCRELVLNVAWTVAPGLVYEPLFMRLAE